MNQTIVTRLRCKLNDNNEAKCWPKLLEMVTNEYNKTPHSVTGFSPQYLMYGLLPYPALSDTIPDMHKAREISFQNSIKNHELNKKYYDRNHQEFSFIKDDL